MTPANAEYEQNIKTVQADETHPPCTIRSEERHYTVVQIDPGNRDLFLAETFLGSFRDYDFANRCVDSRQLRRSTKDDGPTTKSCRLQDEREWYTNVQNHVTPIDHTEGTEGQDFEEPMLIIDGWEELQLLLAESETSDDPELQLVMYGLFQASIGTRRSMAQRSIEAIRRSVMDAWHDQLRPGTTAYLYIVRPQQCPGGEEMQLLVEFTNRFFAQPVEDIPVVRQTSWEGVWSESEPAAAYHTQGISTFQLLIQSGLMEWCGPNLRTICTMQIERQIVPALTPVRLNHGSFLQINIHLEDVEEHVALYQKRVWTESPNPHVSDLCCGAVDCGQTSVSYEKQYPSCSTAPKMHAGSGQAGPSWSAGQDQTATNGTGHNSSGSSGINEGSDYSSYDETSGSDFDPENYGWDDELPEGLVKVACFKRGPMHASEPILAIVSMRNEDDLHDHLATLYRMPARFIKGIIPVAPEPAFAVENGAWPIIVEQTQDRYDPTTQKLVVIQADYYYSRANAGDMATQWRVAILPHQSSRSDVIATTDALNYCEALADGRCLVWHRNELWPQQGQDHVIMNGDLLRVAIPPIDEDMCESTWIRVQDTYDAGRLVGFPPEGSEDEHRELTPCSSVTGLRSSSCSAASDRDSDMQDHPSRDGPERVSPPNTEGRGLETPQPNDHTGQRQRHQPGETVPEGVTNLYPEEIWIGLLTEAGATEQQSPVVFYGLLGDHVGTRRGRVRRFDRRHLSQLVDRFWPEHSHHRKNLIVVTPQPNDADPRATHIIAEFVDARDQPHPRLTPVLEDLHIWYPNGQEETIRQAVYHRTEITQKKMLFGLLRWCDDSAHYYCHGWLREQPLRPEEPYILRPGDLVTLRILPKRPEEMAWSTEYLPNAASYYHDTVAKSAQEPIEKVHWNLHYVAETGDTATIVKEARWQIHQQPQEIVEAFRNSLCPEAPFEAYFVPFGRIATGNEHFVAHHASEQNEVCLISIVVQTPAGIEEETTQGIVLSPTTSTNHILAAAGYPRWDNSDSCAVTVQINGEIVTDEGGITVRSGDYVQMTVSVMSWSQLAADLLQAEAAGTSLLQLKAVRKDKVTISLFEHLDNDEHTTTVKLPIDNEQIAQFLGAWYSVPVGQLDQLPADVELPEATTYKLKQVKWSEDANILHLFTDGSFDAGNGTMAWSFVAVYTNDDDYQAATEFFCLGYACGVVTIDPEDEQWKGAKECNAYVAEMEALLHAHWWAIGNHNGYGLHFHYDALSAGNAARGVWGFSPSHKLCSMTRILAQSLQICSAVKVQYKHVPAHSGDPWNELADTIANACRKGTLLPTRTPAFNWKPWLEGTYVIAAEHLPLSLQALQGRQDLPVGGGGSLTFRGYDSSPTSDIALWPLDLQDDRGDQRGGRIEKVQLKCCSYNVRTLQDPKVGPPVGAAEYLRAQFTYLQYHICALQETRAKQSATVESADYIRLIVAGEGGQEGTEIWFSKTARIGHHEPCALQHLTVLHQEPTIVSVRMRVGPEFLVILSVHAPHSGYSERDRENWWNRLEKVIRNARTRGRIILMGDMNAQLGEAIEGAVGDVLNAKSTSNGTLLGRLLQNTSLWIPATYQHHHTGDIGTWIHPGTKQAIRLDYIIIDHRFAAFDLESSIEDDIDYPGMGEDHRAVRLTFCFALRRKPTTTRRAQIDEIALADPSNESRVEEVFRMVETIPWSTNIHDHYAILAKSLHSELSRIFPQQRKAPRRHYISRTTWMCRASKLAMKKSLKEARNRGDDEGAKLLVQQIKEAAAQLRGLLQADKQRHVDDLLEQVDQAPPQQLFAQLRRLGIGAQMKKYSNKALPMMRKTNGDYATSHQESQEAWREHASALEGGRQTDGHQLLQLCHQRQTAMQQRAEPNGNNIPTRLQIERACRRLRPFKARGPDGLPAALYHHYPSLMTELMHPLLVKMTCQTVEPLGFKGGKLVHLYKGKGAHDEPVNRRGILISNHMSKVAHSSIRGQYMPFLEKGMLPMQIGGRAHRSVQQGAHMLRLFMDVCRSQSISCCVVFLDIRTAYYKVLRELVSRQETAQGRLQELLQAFNLPPESLHQLERKLEENSTTSRRMGLGSYLEHMLSELHTDTWFTTQGLDGVTATTIGTRPGSCFADVFFNYLFAEVIKEVKDELIEYGMLTEVQWGGVRSLYMDGTQTDSSEIIAETVWADDLALFFQHADPDQLVANLREGSTVLLNACMRYGLEPNFSHGKTEAIVALRGKGSVRARRQWFTENNGRLHLPDCAAPETYIRMIARYRHLGGQVDARATSRAEIRARTGQVRQVFRRYKKSLFVAQSIAREKRAQLLRPFVLSVLEYNLGTLVGLTETDRQCVATTLLSIYRAVWRDSRGPEDYKISWPRLCYALQLPSPNAIIQMARIRYFSQILRHGGSALWALISTQQGWLRDCADAFDWMYQQISGSTPLRHPKDDWAAWSKLMIERPKRFAGLIQRAWKHEMIQNYNTHIVDEGYSDFAEAMDLANFDFPEVMESPKESQAEHICLSCQRVFGSRTGWASHAFKCHQRVNKARLYAGGTYCAACNTEYWEYKRLLHHLRYSGKCRRTLARARMEVPQEPGIGSRHQKQQREELLQPCSTVPGVSLPVKDFWAGVDVDWDEQLLDELFYTIPLDETQEHRTVDDLLEVLRAELVQSTVEFKTVRITLECWKDSMLDVAHNSTRERAGLIRAFFLSWTA